MNAYEPVAKLFAEAQAKGQAAPTIQEVAALVINAVIEDRKTLSQWFFVYDENGEAMAAFPERGLAESYSEDLIWKITEGPALVEKEALLKS